MKKQEIIEFGKQLYEKDLTFATSGNISVKTDDGILITASGTSLGRLEEDDIVLMDFDGNVIGAGKPSCEKMLHVEVYNQAWISEWNPLPAEDGASSSAYAA